MSGVHGGKTIDDPAEASSNATTLIKFTQAIQDAGTASERKGWYYLNADNGEEGPFQSDWMHSWLKDKALNADTLIRCGDGPTFITLKSMIPNCDEVTEEDDNPFDLHFAREVEGVMDILEKVGD